MLQMQERVHLVKKVGDKVVTFSHQRTMTENFGMKRSRPVHPWSTSAIIILNTKFFILYLLLLLLLVENLTRYSKSKKAASITFTFSTCDITDEDTTITIWDGIDTGDWNYVTYNDDSCGRQSKLTWTVPDNSIYYVKFGEIYYVPYSLNATWSTDVDWDYCFPPTSKPTLAPSSTTMPSSTPSAKPSSQPSATPSAAPSTKPSTEPSAAPSTTPSNKPSAAPSTKPSSQPSATPSTTPSTKPSAAPSNKPSSQPSSQPSTVPTSKPSSFPSSQPTHLSCEMVNPCDYDMEDDGVGGIEVTETYYPVCIRQDTKKKSYYRQECYPESVIAGLGAGDVDPEHDDRMIVSCGCCPSDDDMLPADIEKVKGNTDVCGGGLDCFAEAASVTFSKSGKGKSESSKSGKKIYFQMCIDGDDDHWGQNFYVPSDDETASCGQCDFGDIVV